MLVSRASLEIGWVVFFTVNAYCVAPLLFGDGAATWLVVVCAFHTIVFIGAIFSQTSELLTPSALKGALVAPGPLPIHSRVKKIANFNQFVGASTGF